MRTRDRRLRIDALCLSPSPNGVKLFSQKTLSVTGVVEFLLLRRGGKVILRGREPSAPTYVHFGGPKMDEKGLAGRK